MRQNDIKASESVDRQELVVWLHSTKKMRLLMEYGYIYYVSKRRKYAILYVDAENADQSMEKIQKLSFVIKVEESPKNQINMDFSTALDEEAAKADRILAERRKKRSIYHR